MALPLQQSFEYFALRTACELPPQTRRQFFGAPPQIEGQELAEEMHVLLRLAAAAGEDSVSDGGVLSPEQARARLRRRAAAAAGPPLPIAVLKTIPIPGPGGQIATRLYVAGPVLPPQPWPLLVFFHGGGGTIGDLDTHDGLCRFLATHSDAAVLSVAYRLAPEHPFPAAVDDAVASFFAGRFRKLASTASTPNASPSAATAPVAPWPPTSASSPVKTSVRTRRCRC